MMHNNFGRDQLRVTPCQRVVRVIGKLCELFEQIPGPVRSAGETPEVGRTLQRHAHHVATIMGAVSACLGLV